MTHVRSLWPPQLFFAVGIEATCRFVVGPKTGSLVWVEKNGKGWNLRVDEAPELVQLILAATPS